jgi:hypothetical protein
MAEEVERLAAVANRIVDLMQGEGVNNNQGWWINAASLPRSGVAGVWRGRRQGIQSARRRAYRQAQAQELELMTKQQQQWVDNVIEAMPHGLRTALMSMSQQDKNVAVLWMNAPRRWIVVVALMQFLDAVR